jgi:hypothetical protein
MQEHSNPIEYLIEFAWANGAARFVVNNAKDELKRLMDKSKELEDIKKSLANPTAWAKINEHGDLYDLRLQNNPYNNQEKIVPLYTYRINNDNN